VLSIRLGRVGVGVYQEVLVVRLTASSPSSEEKFLSVSSMLG